MRVRRGETLHRSRNKSTPLGCPAVLPQPPSPRAPSPWYGTVLVVSDSPPGWIRPDLWAATQASIPIVCVDVVPVRRDPLGSPVQVGLIRRLGFEDRAVWCHVGGRVLLGESLAEALSRHLRDTLQLDILPLLGPDPQPLYVQQYFREERPDVPSAGRDPRKHAVGLSYVVTLEGTPSPVRGGEALEFSWFNVEELSAVTDVWPGSMRMVRAVLAADAAL